MTAWRWLRSLLGKPESTVEPAVTPAPAPAARTRSRTGRTSPPSATSGRGRPVSNSLARAIEMLRANPELASQEIASDLPVSRDYARTLLRRARAQLQQEAPAPPPKRVVLKVQTAGAKASASQRSLVLRRALKGESPQAIAASLGIPSGEVDFILKVERLLEAAR